MDYNANFVEKFVKTQTVYVIMSGCADLIQINN